LREFWKQRRKYAEWNVALARRHPEFFAPFQSPSDLQRVRTETVRRLARDMLFAVPRALRPIPGKNSTRIDPLLDGVAAIANYAGVAPHSERLPLKRVVRSVFFGRRLT